MTALWSAFGGPLLIAGIALVGFAASLAFALLIGALIRAGQGGDKAARVPSSRE